VEGNAFFRQPVLNAIAEPVGGMAGQETGLFELLEFERERPRAYASECEFQIGKASGSFEEISQYNNADRITDKIGDLGDRAGSAQDHALV
jgi:hypothetical protein